MIKSMKERRIVEQAFKDGKEIEFCNIDIPENTTWKSISNPSFGWDGGIDYRVKVDETDPNHLLDLVTIAHSCILKLIAEQKKLELRVMELENGTK